MSVRNRRMDTTPLLWLTFLGSLAALIGAVWFM